MSIRTGLARIWNKYVRGMEFRGTDLRGNRYWEFPNPNNPALTKRIIQYKEKKDWADYLDDEMPVQWSSWLRHNRKDPPQHEEILEYQRRLATTLTNAKRLDAEWQEERQRLAQRSEPQPTKAIPDATTKPTPPPVDRPNQTNPGEGYSPSNWQPATKRR